MPTFNFFLSLVVKQQESQKHICLHNVFIFMEFRDNFKFFIFILFSYSFYNSKIKRKEEYIYIYMFFFLLSEKAEDIFIWHAYINE